MPISAPSPKVNALSDGHRAAEDQAVDMGIDETARYPARNRSLDQEGVAQALRVVARDVVGAGAVEYPHRHAASSSASTWRSASDRQRMASAWP